MAASVCAGPPLGCCSWLQAVIWCLVTSPCSVTGVLLTVWVLASAVRAGTGPSAGSVCFQSPAGGQNSSAWSLFLHLPRILAQLGPNFDEVAFCRYGCLFFKATCRHVWQCLDLDLWMFSFHKSISSYWWLSWNVGPCSECDIYFIGYIYTSELVYIYLLLCLCSLWLCFLLKYPNTLLFFELSSAAPTPALYDHGWPNLLVFLPASAGLFICPCAAWQGGLARSSTLGTEHTVHSRLMRAFLMRRSR